MYGSARSTRDESMRDRKSTARGPMLPSGRLSVLEQLEKNLKQDRPWERDSWDEKHKPRETATNPKPSFTRTSVQQTPTVAFELGKCSLPGSLELCHELIFDLQTQLREVTMLDASEIEKKEKTIEGISDMFALSTLTPDKKRMLREYNEMKAKYQDNLLQLTRVQQELDTVRADAIESEARLRDALTKASDGRSDNVLEAERQIRETHRLREQDAELAIQAVESATRRCDAAEARMREVEDCLRSHPAVVREGLAGKDLAGILPVLLQHADEKLEVAQGKEKQLQETRTALEQALEEIGVNRERSNSHASIVNQYEVEMGSLRAKLERTEADLKALQVEHDLMSKEKESIASDSNQLVLAMEREAMKHREVFSDLQERYQQCQAHIDRMTSAEAEISKTASEREKRFATETDDLRKRIEDLEAQLKGSLKEKDLAQSHSSNLEARLSGAAKDLQTRTQELQSRLLEVEGELTRVKTAKHKEAAEKDEELQKLRSAQTANQKTAREAGEQATQRISTLEKMLGQARDEAVAAKMDAQSQTSNSQRALKEKEHALQEAQNDLFHAQRILQLTAAEADDLRKQLDDVRIELHKAKAHARALEEEAMELNRVLNSTDATIERKMEQMKSQHTQELARVEEKMRGFQEMQRRVEEELVRETQQRFADKQMAAEQLKTQLSEERARSERELELQNRRHEEERDHLAASNRRSMQDLEARVQRERLEEHAKIAEMREELREKEKRRQELDEDLVRKDAFIQGKESELARMEQALDASQQEGANAHERALQLENELVDLIAEMKQLEQTREELEESRESVKQALAAAQADNNALRERLKEDSLLHAETEKSATQAMEEILLERVRERDHSMQEREKALVQADAAHEQAMQQVKTRHEEALQELKTDHDRKLENILTEHHRELEIMSAEKLEIIVAEREQRAKMAEEQEADQRAAAETIARLQRTQTELEAALAESNAERENEEMQAHEAMNIVAAEMTAIRSECSALEEQLTQLRKEKVEDSKQVLQLNMLLEQQVHEHEHVQGSLKAALKVADEDIEKFKTQCRKLQSDLSTERALRERDQEDAQKELQELSRLQLELKDRDDRLDAMRNEALFLKAEVLTASPQRISHSTAHPVRPQSQQNANHWLDREGTPSSAPAGDLDQWRRLMANGHDALSRNEMDMLAMQQKQRIYQLFQKSVKREMADMKASVTYPSMSVCALWQALLVLLGNVHVQELIVSQRHQGAASAPLEWPLLRKHINTNPGQFDKASVLFLMEQHVPGEVDVGHSMGWTLQDRCSHAAYLLEGLTYDGCKSESVTSAALYEWITIVLDMHRLCEECRKMQQPSPRMLSD